MSGENQETGGTTTTPAQPEHTHSAWPFKPSFSIQISIPGGLTHPRHAQYTRSSLASRPHRHAPPWGLPAVCRTRTIGCNRLGVVVEGGSGVAAGNTQTRTHRHTLPPHSKQAKTEEPFSRPDQSDHDRFSDRFPYCSARQPVLRWRRPTHQRCTTI